MVELFSHTKMMEWYGHRDERIVWTSYFIFRYWISRSNLHLNNSVIFIYISIQM